MSEPDECYCNINANNYLLQYTYLSLLPSKTMAMHQRDLQCDIFDITNHSTDVIPHCTKHLRDKTFSAL